MGYRINVDFKKNLDEESTETKSDSSDIWNCKFTFQCPKRWKELTPIDGSDPDIRFCSKCEQKVYRCTTETQLASAIEENRCVAVKLKLSRGDADEIHLVGVPVKDD